MPITFATNSRRNCAQIPWNGAPASRNQLLHEVLRSWAAVCNSLWSEESGNLCILLPDDMDDFIIRPPVDVDVVQILKTMQYSRRLPIPQISPGDNGESGIASIDPSDAPLLGKFRCPDDYIDAPED
jgi:hypothetical protein